MSRRPLARLLALLLVVPALLLGPIAVGPHGSPAWAAFSDSGTMGSGTFTAARVAPPTLYCGLLGVLSVGFEWTSVPGATSYTLHYGYGGEQTLTTTATSATLVSVINGGTAWVVANRAFAKSTWRSVSSSSREYTVAAVSLCA